MSDGMTPEQREKLREWMREQGSEIQSAASNTDVRGLIDFLTAEALLLVRAASDLIQMESLTYYAQAIIDLEYFAEHGQSLRAATSPEDRAIRAHNLVMRLAAKAEKS